MRPSRDVRMMLTALAQAQGSTCLRRAVGCVLVDARGHILATGYNGVAAGQPHCNQEGAGNFKSPALNSAVEAGLIHTYPHACSGAHAPSGSDLLGCDAIHAEQNALAQCRDAYAIDTAYVTTAPCDPCTKLLLGTSCRRVVFLDTYKAPGEARWLRAGRLWERLGSAALEAGSGSVEALLEAIRRPEVVTEPEEAKGAFSGGLGRD